MATATPKVALRLLLAGLACGALALALHFGSPWAMSDTASGFLSGIAVGLLLAALLRWRMPESCDTGTPALRSRYLRQFMPAMVALRVRERSLGRL